MSELMVIRPPGTMLCTCCGFALARIHQNQERACRFVDMWCTTELCEHNAVIVRVPFTTVACEIIEPNKGEKHV